MIRRDITALVQLLDSRLSMPHCWGSHANDCISFADAAVKAQTGHSALGGRRWSNKVGALRVLKHEGGLVAALDRRFERVPVAVARRGDIAGVPIEAMIGIADEELALIELHPMIIEGATLAAPGEYGLRRAKRGLATVAWDITARKRR